MMSSTCFRHRAIRTQYDVGVPYRGVEAGIQDVLAHHFGTVRRGSYTPFRR
jgi:hypothetical protein